MLVREKALEFVAITDTGIASITRVVLHSVEVIDFLLIFPLIVWLKDNLDSGFTSSLPCDKDIFQFIQVNILHGGLKEIL